MKDDTRVLDVGYGTGHLLEKLAARFPDVTLSGVENSRELYAHSQSKLSSSGIRVACADFASFAPESTFDVVIFSFFLHHTADFRVHLGKALSLLNEGGKIVIADRIAMTDAAKGEFKKYWEAHYCSQHEWKEDCPVMYSRQDLKLFSQARGLVLGTFVLNPHDDRRECENFPKTLVTVERGQ